MKLSDGRAVFNLLDNLENIMKLFGIPQKDWKGVLLYILVTAFVCGICLKYLPIPIGMLACAWYIVGQGVLVKYNVVSKSYPDTLGGALVGAFMSLFWPLFMSAKRG